MLKLKYQMILLGIIFITEKLIYLESVINNLLSNSVINVTIFMGICPYQQDT